MNNKTLYLGESDAALAAELLAKGGLVALPTETVYGLACDCQNLEAVERLYALKGRPKEKALSVLLDGMSMVEKVCKEIPPVAYSLAKAFWPGPLTMVLSSAHVVADPITAGGDTLGVRCPDHPGTLAVIGALGRPVAAPSANLSGQESPKSANEVRLALDGKIEAILDGGPCLLAVESTILDLTTTPPVILRQGALPRERIFTLLEEEGAL